MARSRRESFRLDLPRPLRDAIQQCEVRCSALCCSTAAFDPNPVHILPWALSRGPAEVACALNQLETILCGLAGRRHGLWADDEHGAFNTSWPTAQACVAYLLDPWQRVLLETYTQTVPEALRDRSWRAWNHGAVVGLARTIQKERAYHLLPILGDALDEAGCLDPALLCHCREPAEHARQCWALDLILRAEEPASCS
jgi:hypothetical protein